MAIDGIHQVKALAAKFHQAGPTVMAKAEQVVAKTALDVQGWAQTLAPVDTGFLENSLGADIGGLTAVVGAAAMYAGYVEGGTYKMAAQPFLEPAVTIVEPQFVAAMEQLGADIL